MSEEQDQMDYEALNARTALDLNKAQQEIERLEGALREIEELPPEHTRAYVSQDIAREALAKLDQE